MSEPKADELSRILDALRAGVDPDTKQPHISWPEANAQLRRYIDRKVLEGRIQELERLNSYYMRHDGEGEHQLAVQFAKRLAELTDERGGDDDQGTAV